MNIVRTGVGDAKSWQRYSIYSPLRASAEVKVSAFCLLDNACIENIAEFSLINLSDEISNVQVKFKKE